MRALLMAASQLNDGQLSAEPWVRTKDFRGRGHRRRSPFHALSETPDGIDDGFVAKYDMRVGFAQLEGS